MSIFHVPSVAITKESEYNGVLIQPFVDFLGKQLDDYVATLPLHVYVVRMGKRSGLIRARLRGSLHSFCIRFSMSHVYCDCLCCTPYAHISSLLNHVVSCV